ncbi:YihY/virulence factor BrkB family protein [Halobaculum limi]|uniref:YihY/virulence factor BrkB family protein n=1 Tax=Halobaculum limi TaxID=3031916 RepID=UPI0024065023|nr:YihY/virulence factor BrkB family protein [Halobaculum sp. YSMS11]
MDRHRVVSLARAVVHEVRTEKITFLAGSVAYHAFVSLLPLLVLVVVVLSSVGGRGLESSFESLVAAALTPNAGRELLAELERASASRTLSVAGVAVLMWGALRVFRGLDTAFSDIYETEAENTFLDQLGDGVLVLVTFGLAVVVGAALTDAVAGVATGPAGWALSRFALALALTVTLFPMYYVFPDADVSAVEVLPGAVFAGAGLTAAESLFRVYVSWSSAQPDQSVIAAILVFLSWLYLSGLLLLLGAAVNAVLSNRSADVDIAPVFGGVQRAPDRPNREAVVDDLDHLQRLLAAADGDEGSPVAVTVSFDSESVTLPPPTRVEVDTEALLRGRDVGVSMWWTPDPDAVDESADSEATAARDGGRERSS